MIKVSLKAILCLLIFYLSSAAQTSPNLLRELLDLPAPPPVSKNVEKRRPAGFYDDKNPPDDDASIEDLLDYWNAKADAFYPGNSKPPVASVKTALRLIEIVQNAPDKFGNFLKILPTDPEIAERVKLLYDSKQAATDASDGWRENVKEWLKFKSAFFAEELFREAQKAQDDPKYESVNKVPELTALAKFDWDAAQPLLEKLENDKTNPRTAVLAKTLFYRHALREKDENETEKYRSQLKEIVENRDASRSERELAFKTLTENSDWQGFDNWYLSLFADETLLELRLSESSVISRLDSPGQKNLDKWIPLLTDLAASKNLTIRTAAAQSLLEIKRKEALVPLLPLLKNSDWVKKEVVSKGDLISAIREIEMPESVEDLIWVVANDDDFAALAALTLIKYKPAEAVPALKTALDRETSEGQREYFITALIACGGFSDAELVEALEIYVQAILTPEGFKKIEERNEYEEENPLPLQISTGKFLARQKAPGDGFVRALFERLKELGKTKPDAAKKLLEIANKWEGKAIEAEMLGRIAAGNADLGTILTVLARRTELRENVPLELSRLTGKNPLASAVVFAILEDEAQMTSLVNGDAPETQIAALACARLLRLKLPVRDVGLLLASNNQLLALAAERYLESEDSREARDLVLARHPGEALILGARESFNPAKQKVSGSDSPLGKLFMSLNSYLYGFDTRSFDKEEERFRKEILADKNLLEIYAYQTNSLKIYRDKAVFSWHTDYWAYFEGAKPSRYYEKVLTEKELESFRRFVIENNIDDLKPIFGGCHHNCGAIQFITLNRNGGRRFFAYTGWDQLVNFWDAFESLRSDDAKLHYELEKYVSGLEVLLTDKRYQPTAIWKNGDDFRVLVEDLEKQRQISDEIQNLEKLDDQNENLDYQTRGRMARKRRAERAFEHFEWRKFAGGRLGERVDEPLEVPFLRDNVMFPAMDDLSANDSLRNARSGNYEIRVGSSFDSYGLWKVNRQEQIKIRDGWFKYPVTTPDGKWAVASKTDSNWDNPNYLVRLNLQTGKEQRINLPPAKSLAAVTFVAAHGKMLVRGAGAGGDDKNFLYYLLDAETGALEKVTGEFRPLRQQTFRSLQPVGKPNEFWAAVSDGEATEIGIYDTKLFRFDSRLKLPEISLTSMNIWVDEKAGKLYFVYRDQFGRDGHLLALPLPGN